MPSDRPNQSYIDHILTFAAGAVVGSFIILAILVLAGASNAK